MKQKISKKITLRKQTISDLSQTQMKNLRGGTAYTELTCDTDLFCTMPECCLRTYECTKFGETCPAVCPW